jgi:hypothetical protein
LAVRTVNLPPFYQGALEKSLKPLNFEVKEGRVGDDVSLPAFSFIEMSCSKRIEILNQALWVALGLDSSP